MGYSLAAAGDIGGNQRDESNTSMETKQSHCSLCENLPKIGNIGGSDAAKHCGGAPTMLFAGPK
ncbi:hypothetical protein M8997_008720 [Phyllobacterium sp. 21LDTY02-6]|uniref:hypothetical protein n=1 Tax=Phyllobacterium sp. 21LDTY02-6 TaxID=2944903 RepID=UPI00201FFC60|nr:hypothetical protein [Phyllobacterium sp. 21LDTY02-6]MCO4317261.1 hypothetical protein [Phyllobacterium sp. 21LDTY02-6]